MPTRCHKRGARRVALVALLLLLGGVARAQQPAADVLLLRDGTMLQGRVTELRPGQSVLLVLFNGESRLVPWANIAQASGPSFPVAAPPPQALPLPQQFVIAAAEPYLRPAPGRVPLYVQSTGARLHVGVRQGTGSAVVGNQILLYAYGRSLCESPCVLYVSPGPFALWVSGDGLRETVTEIDVPPSGMEVRMRPSRAGPFLGGVMLMTFGFVGALAGAILLPIGMFNTNIDSTGHMVGAPEDSLVIAGSVCLGAGLAALASGIALVAINRGGVAESRTLPPPQVSFTPTTGGAVASLRFRF